MRNALKLGRSVLTALLVISTLVSLPGCGAIATVAWLIHGPEKVPAKFAGLSGKRVAVVCLDGNSLRGPGGEADSIAKAVSISLGYHVSDVEMVRFEEIADWVDNRSDDLTDYRDVGRGVKADMVVGIDLASLSIHEGQTLLKGRARTGVKVFDMKKGGQVVYEVPVKEISWPESGARHVTENEANFRAIFIHMLAQKISQDFYDYELIEEFGKDAAHLAN